MAYLEPPYGPLVGNHWLGTIVLFAFVYVAHSSSHICKRLSNLHVLEA